MSGPYRGTDALLIEDTAWLLQLLDVTTCRCTDPWCTEPHDTDGGDE